MKISLLQNIPLGILNYDQIWNFQELRNSFKYTVKHNRTFSTQNIVLNIRNMSDYYCNTLTTIYAIKLYCIIIGPTSVQCLL